MEDSLRRLQRIKQSKSSSANMALSGIGNSAMSDDDKIRLQINLDVVEFGDLFADKFNGYKGGAHYEALFKLIEDANSLNSQTVSQTSSALNPTPEVDSEINNFV